MKNKLSLLIFSLVMMFLLGSFERVFACSCQRTTSCEAYNSSDVAFVGKVVGSKYQKNVEDYSESQNSNTNASSQPRTITYDVGEIYFEVQESFGGVEKGSRITVHSSTGGGDCGYWFKRGETYLVYAYKEDSDASGAVSSLTYNNSDETEQLQPDANRLWTNICSRTAPISRATEDLDFLRNLSDQPKGKIFGQINQKFYFNKDDEEKPFVNLTLNFRKIDDGQSFTTKTDESGIFEIRIPAGKYKINPLLPEYAELLDYQAEFLEKKVIEIKADGCEKLNLTAESKSKISGKLFSADGNTVKGVDVELIDFYTKEWVSDAESNEDGTFSIENIPVGRYIIAINKNLSPHAESPFPTYFYPFFFTLSRAQIFTIDLGKSIENLTFLLPPKLKEQEISGVVVWANGKPVANARVEIDDTNDDSFFRAERVTETDVAGRFNLKGFIGRSYTLKAKFEKYEPLSKEEAEKEMAKTNKITMIMSGDEVDYARVKRGETKIKPFKVASKAIFFRIILKEE